MVRLLQPFPKYVVACFYFCLCILLDAVSEEVVALFLVLKNTFNYGVERNHTSAVWGRAGDRYKALFASCTEICSLSFLSSSRRDVKVSCA